MYVGRDFDPLQVVEKDSFSLDFVNNLAAGETLLSAEWECEVFQASEEPDPDAATRLVGAATVTGTTTSQFVGNEPVVGCTYVLTAIVETSLGKTLSMWSKFLCQNSPDAA